MPTRVWADDEPPRDDVWSEEEREERRRTDEERRRKAVVREWARIAVLVLCVLSVWLSSYQGRVDQAHDTQADCERGKLDRAANAKAWRQAEEARRGDGDTDIADLYAGVAAGLEKRADLDCTEAFPEPSLLPF